MKEIRYIENEIEKWIDGKKMESFFSLNPQSLRDMLDRWVTDGVDWELQHQGVIFDVGKTGMELPSGKYVEREIVINSEVVCVMPVDTDNNILFIRQMRPVSEFPFLELPAGRIEDDEEPLDAAIREMGEETGFEPENIFKLGSFFTSPGWCTEFVHCFLVTGLTPSSLVPDEDEEIELVKVPVNNVMDMIQRGEIIDSMAIATLFLAIPKFS